jgi:polysaccharide biosynthesis protein PslH
VRILFQTTVLPSERRTGGEVVSAAFVAALRDAGNETTVLGYRRPGSSASSAPGDVAAGVRPIETTGAGWRVAPWLARSLLTARPYSTSKYVSRAYRAALAELSSPSPHLVIVDHAQAGWATTPSVDVPLVYLAHNVEHALYAELAQTARLGRPLYARECRLVRRQEAALCRSCAELWTLTAADAAALSALGARRTRVFSVPPATIPQAPGQPTCDIALLGTWTWQSNAAGLRWFADAVLPHLDGLVVRVAGAGAREAIGERRGLDARGVVPDATAFLQQARAIAVPAVAGSGVQVKTLDAIASGRRVVATPTAMRGIEDPPASVSVAAEPAAFAAALRAAVDTGAADDGIEWARERALRFGAEVRAAVHELQAASP